MKKLFILISIFIINISLYSQDPPPPQLGPGETWTNLWSRSYDYQTNGSIRYLVQDPTNSSGLCAILMAQKDSNGAAGVNRYIYYSYTKDNGSTWTSSVLDESTSWGFPDMSLRNGIPIIAAHIFNVRPSVFQDVLFGGFSFVQLAGIPTNVISNWPHLTGTSNGNIVLAGSLNTPPIFTGHYTTYNGASWTLWTPLPSLSGPSGNFSVEAGTNGVVGIFGLNYDGNSSVYWHKSTDNGITFDNGTLIFDYVLDGTDTLFANIAGGLQAVFVNEEPHLLFTVYNINSGAIFPDPNTLAYIKPKILHWSPSTGIRQVAGKFNIPILSDTITTALMAPVGQPSIGVTTSGKLKCTFTTFIRGNTQVVQDGSVLNAGEIFYSESNDNGMNWSIPVNITNTPSVEEKHSSLINKGNADSLKVFYIRDMLAGGWVNIPAWGKAPVYGIFKKALIVGIKNNNTLVKSFELFQNYPNPFNPSTIIKFNIPKSTFTSLIIYDVNGREITRLVDEKLNAGGYEYNFSSERFGLSSGVYYYKLIAGDYISTKKMILIK